MATDPPSTGGVNRLRAAFEASKRKAGLLSKAELQHNPSSPGLGTGNRPLTAPRSLTDIVARERQLALDAPLPVQGAISEFPIWDEDLDVEPILTETDEAHQAVQEDTQGSSSRLGFDPLHDGLEPPSHPEAGRSGSNEQSGKSSRSPRSAGQDEGQIDRMGASPAPVSKSADPPSFPDMDAPSVMGDDYGPIPESGVLEDLPFPEPQQRGVETRSSTLESDLPTQPHSSPTPAAATALDPANQTPPPNDAPTSHPGRIAESNLTIEAPPSSALERLRARQRPMEEMFLFNREPVVFTQTDLQILLIKATQKGVSDVFLTTGYPVIAKLYKRLVRLTRRPVQTHELLDLVDREFRGGSTQLISGTPQDFSLDFTDPESERVASGRRYRFRVCVTPVLSPTPGQAAVEWTLRPIATNIPLIEDQYLDDAIIDAAFPPSGLVLVTGPTNSGKSTLLSAIMRELVGLGRRIVTFEAPIEYPINTLLGQPGFAVQSEIGRHLAGDEWGNFAAGVTNSLRRSPDVIFIGEARDPQTIQGTITAAETGHAVYATVHTNGAPETIKRMADEYEPAHRPAIMAGLVRNIRLIVHQRLVASTDGKRVALREYIAFDRQLREKILFDDFSRFFKNLAEGVETHGLSLQKDAERKFKEGRIDRLVYTEIMRDRGKPGG